MDGNRLKEARLARRLSQAELGRLIGVGKSAISQYEHGLRNPDGKVLLRLAEVLGTSVDWLLGRADDGTAVREGRVAYGPEVPVSSPPAPEKEEKENEDFLAELSLQARAIASAADRQLLLALARSLAAKNSPPDPAAVRPSTTKKRR
ncbi:MAG: helix-turn-helix domain-containing protein [Bacillota bacterium]